MSSTERSTRSTGPALSPEQAAAAVLAQDLRTAPVEPTSLAESLANQVLLEDQLQNSSVVPTPPVIPRGPGLPSSPRPPVTTTSTVQSSSQQVGGIEAPDSLSPVMQQQVLDMIKSSMDRAVGDVVKKIADAHKPQLDLQADQLREATRAQQEAAEARRAADQALQQSRADLQALRDQQAAADEARRVALLPHRAIDETRDNGRLRGHARNPGRLEELRRQLVGKGLNEDQIQRVANMMDANEKVSSTPPAQNTQHALPPLWALGAVGGNTAASFATAPGGPADSLFSVLRAQGFATPEAATTPMEVLAETVTLASAANGGKAPKTFALPTSYKAWVLKLREQGWATPALHALNPSHYWALEWVRQTVEFVHFEYSWAVASVYFERLMFEWGKGWVDPSTYSAMEEFKCGHIEASLVPRLLEYAWKKKGKTSGASSSSTVSKWERKGTKDRVNASDTWCACHELFYLVADDHHWDAATETGTCMVAKSRKGGGKKKKK